MECSFFFRPGEFQFGYVRGGIDCHGHSKWQRVVDTARQIAQGHTVDANVTVYDAVPAPGTVRPKTRLQDKREPVERPRIREEIVNAGFHAAVHSVDSHAQHETARVILSR